MEGDHEVDNVRLTAALAAAARARGATFLTHTLVTQIFVEGDRVTGVEAGGRKIPAGQVVDAAGAWARLIPGVPQTLVPVMPAPGLACMVALRPMRPTLLALTRTLPVAMSMRSELMSVGRVGLMVR